MPRQCCILRAHPYGRSISSANILYLLFSLALNFFISTFIKRLPRSSFIFGLNFIMNTSSCRLNLAPEATASERRTSSQGDAPPSKLQISSKFTDQAPSPLNHPPAAGSHDKTPPKSPSHSSTVYSDSAKHQISREEQEIGKAVAVDGNNTHEEALRALEAYAAFQVTLLRELTDDITFKSPHG